ncbi:MAG: hypothetical protein LAT64_05285 [Phycisphaerales bacterium]|nr:hypothetical protein [Planctomycetota bacterium]MCH8508168.1 hypothetical protein [Phycisphaerales bacterium]
MEHDHTAVATDARVSQRGGWLWISAGVLAALTVVQGAGLLDRPASAEMVSNKGGYAIMTTRAGSNEIAVLIDERNETLMVYSVENRRRVVLQDRQSLPEMFNRARLQAGHPARP